MNVLTSTKELMITMSLLSANTKGILRCFLFLLCEIYKDLKSSSNYSYLVFVCISVYVGLNPIADFIYFSSGYAKTTFNGIIMA